MFVLNQYVLLTNMTLIKNTAKIKAFPFSGVFTFSFPLLLFEFWEFNFRPRTVKKLDYYVRKEHFPSCVRKYSDEHLI